MKLAIFNGSPRRLNSNSKILIEQFLAGYNRIDPERVPVYYLASRKQKEESLEAFNNSDIILIFFPLYTDCMPGIVKEFIEDIAQLNNSKTRMIGFVVQSGFPEAIHSFYVERYLKKLTKRLNGIYLGTIIKGGVEGIQIMPSWMTRKLFKSFVNLGEYFAINQTWSPEIKNKLAKPYKLSPLRRSFLGIMRLTGLANYYWNSNLKKNNAFEKRFDTPYTEIS